MNIVILVFIVSILFRYNSLHDLLADLPKLIVITLSLLSAFCAFLYYNQESLLYQNNFSNNSENPVGFRDPDEVGLSYEDVFFTSPDGFKLHSWMIFSSKVAANKSLKAPTIIFFHGNAGNLGLRLPFLKKLSNVTDFNIFAVSYRGYGLSEGVPSEESIKNDSIQAADLLMRHKNVDQGNVFLFGRSLGGAVAISLAVQQRFHFKGLFVENSFTSISDLVDHLYPMVSIFKKYLLRLRWNSIEIIDYVSCRTLFLSGKSDNIIPPEQMDRLFGKSKAKYKSIIEVEYGDHQNTFDLALHNHLPQIKEFFDTK